MKIAFRADASIQIGTGHVIRCLTLAEELKHKGHECLFICREHKGHLGELITAKGFVLHLLPAGVEADYKSAELNWNDHASWLGVTWQQDAEQTRAILSSQLVDWLVVDHYALDARWERQIAEVATRIMVIDDLADRPHHCNLLLDQNALDDGVKEQYQSLVNSSCKLLLGPKYALLRPEYADLARALPDRDGSISRILVFVGGSDPYHLTEQYIHALAAEEFKHLFVDVVIGKNHPSPKSVEKLVIQRGKARLHTGLPSLAALMIRADLMLGAGGSTNWERMCLGLNSIVVSVARNQDKVNEYLERIKTIYFLGSVEDVSLNIIRSAIKDVIFNELNNATQSKLMRSLVLGEGCNEVTKLIDCEVQ